MRKKNLMAELASRYALFSAQDKQKNQNAVGGAGDQKGGRRRRQSKRLRREMDEVVVGRQIATDRL